LSATKELCAELSPALHRARLALAVSGKLTQSCSPLALAPAVSTLQWQQNRASGVRASTTVGDWLPNAFPHGAHVPTGNEFSRFVTCAVYQRVTRSSAELTA